MAQRRTRSSQEDQEDVALSGSHPQPASDVGSQEERPRKRARREEDAEDEAADNDSEASEDELDPDAEGYTENLLAKEKRRRAKDFHILSEVPVYIEQLRTPYKKDKGKKGGFVEVTGDTNKDYECPYPKLLIPIYVKKRVKSWILDDIARHVGRSVNEIDWDALKWRPYKATRANYKFVGTHVSQWDMAMDDWSKKVKGKVPEIALLVKFQPVQAIITQQAIQTNKEAAPLVAGKPNPLRDLVGGRTLAWKQKLEEHHKVGACPLHQGTRCVQRDGLHFKLEAPRILAWACYLNVHPEDSLDVIPPLHCFNVKFASKLGGQSTVPLDASDSVLQTSSNRPSSIEEAIQVAALAITSSLTQKAASEPAPVPPTMAAPGPHPSKYGPSSKRYHNTPSLEEFCATYGLESAKEKYKKMGFSVGDTPAQLALIPAEERMKADIGTLEWSRLLDAVEYWAGVNERMNHGNAVGFDAV